MKEIKKSSVKVANINDQFDDKLKDNNVTLHERKHIKEEISKLNDFLFKKDHHVLDQSLNLI